MQLELVGGKLFDGVKVDPRVALDPDLSGSAVEDDPAFLFLLVILKVFFELTKYRVNQARSQVGILGFQLK